MNFCYVLGSGSRWQDNEIRYSIRSVLKFHPEAQIHIVGEKPRWYEGPHTYVPDDSKCAYVNQWRKLQKACEIFPEFVYMDDDFFLLEPLEVKHYKYGSLHDYQKNLGTGTIWWDVVTNTYKAMPNAERHLLHAPLPIISKNFMKIAEEYPQRLESPSLVPRQIYCHHETAFEIKEMKDCKLSRTFEEEKIEDRPFFSTDDNIHRMHALFEELYPDPSPFEKTLPVITGDKTLIENALI